jgi:7-cyano-7-deazaguanine synthase
MVTNGGNAAQPPAVLFSAGLDSAVLLAAALADGPAHPIYVRAGLAWEAQEIAAAERLLAAPLYRDAAPMATLLVDMRDVYPATHWAIRGEAPGFDTPDEDVYLDGRNIVLLAKASVFMARQRLSRVLMGPLAGNPFPDATPEFFAMMGQALTLGLAWKVTVETPLAAMHKADVIALGASLGVPFALTLSCMQPIEGEHCGRCSKCRERRDGFLEAGIEDPTVYRTPPER